MVALDVVRTRPPTTTQTGDRSFRSYKNKNVSCSQKALDCENPGIKRAFIPPDAIAV